MINALLIVLYKEDIYTSKSVQSFLSSKPKNTKLVVWDNSPHVLPKEQVDYLKCHVEAFSYNHTPQNLSLSQIYNTFWADNSDSNLLYIFDQDSVFTSEYFEKAELAYNTNSDIGLFIPYVKVGEQLVSPGYFKYYNGGYFDSAPEGRIESKDKLAIASGMAIAIHRVGALRFDENLTFYGIDSKFTLDYSIYCNSIFVLDYGLTHELSQFVKEDPKKTYLRFKSYRHSLLYITKAKESCCIYLIALLKWQLKSIIAYVKYRINLT